MRAKCDKVDWRIVALKNLVQSPRPTKLFGGHDSRVAFNHIGLQFKSQTAHSAVATPQCEGQY